MKRIIGGVTSAMRGSHEFDYQFGYPVLVNDQAMTNLVKSSVTEFLGEAGFKEIPIRMPSEDMAFFHQKVPGCYFYVGAANDEKGLNMPNHNPRYAFDEDALVLGAQVMIRATWNYLTS